MNRAHSQNRRWLEYFQNFNRESYRKRPIRQKCRWVNNIRIDLKEIGVSVRKWMDSARDRDCWRALVNGFHKPWRYLKAATD